MKKTSITTIKLLFTAFLFASFAGELICSENDNIGNESHRRVARSRLRQVLPSGTPESTVAALSEAKEINRFMMLMLLPSVWMAGESMWNYDQTLRHPCGPCVALAALAFNAILIAPTLVYEKDLKLKISIFKGRNLDINKAEHSYKRENKILLSLLSMSWVLLAYGAIFEPELMTSIFPGPRIRV